MPSADTSPAAIVPTGLSSPTEHYSPAIFSSEQIYLPEVLSVLLQWWKGCRWAEQEQSRLDRPLAAGCPAPHPLASGELKGGDPASLVRLYCHPHCTEVLLVPRGSLLCFCLCPLPIALHHPHHTWQRTSAQQCQLKMPQERFTAAR